MSQYFYGYIEYKKDNKWHLLYNPIEKDKPATRVTQGVIRDLLRDDDFGRIVSSKKDPTYVPPPPEEIPGFKATWFSPKEKYLVDDDISDELKNIINAEWDPDNTEGYYHNSYHIITCQDIIDKADKMIKDTISHIHDTLDEMKTKGITNRLSHIESYIEMIANGRKPAFFKNVSAEVPPEDVIDDNEWLKDQLHYYEEDILQNDVPALYSLVGSLVGISDMLGLDAYEVDEVRFVACID